MSVRGKLVVVGGHSRRVGKTAMMEAVLRSTPGWQWRAYKISNHSHHPREARFDSPPSQMERYLAAGAVSAQLLRLTGEDLAGGALQPIEERLRKGEWLLVESNRVVTYLRPDLVIFAVDPLNHDWKASSDACLAIADALVVANDGSPPDPVTRQGRMLPAFRLAQWNRTPLGFAEWLRVRLLACGAGLPESSYQGPWRLV